MGSLCPRSGCPLCVLGAQAVYLSTPKALAVDLGGSHDACAVVSDRDVRAVETVSLEAAHGLAGALPSIAGALKRAAASAGVAVPDCAGLSFGFCGLVDPEAGRVLSTNAKYDDAPRLDLPGWCRESLGLPFRIENDARLALLGERHAGASRGTDDAVMMTLGTGIGGEAMIGGRLLRGKHFQAGVPGGPLVADFEGRPRTCGGVGCVEAEASTWALPGLCRESPGFAASALARRERLDFEGLFDCAAEGDAVAVEVRDRCLGVWGAGAGQQDRRAALYRLLLNRRALGPVPLACPTPGQPWPARERPSSRNPTESRRCRTGAANAHPS